MTFFTFLPLFFTLFLVLPATPGVYAYTIYNRDNFYGDDNVYLGAGLTPCAVGPTDTTAQFTLHGIHFDDNSDLPISTLGSAQDSCSDLPVANNEEGCDGGLPDERSEGGVRMLRISSGGPLRPRGGASGLKSLVIRDVTEEVFSGSVDTSAASEKHLTASLPLVMAVTAGREGRSVVFNMDTMLASVSLAHANPSYQATVSCWFKIYSVELQGFQDSFICGMETKTAGTIFGLAAKSGIQPSMDAALNVATKWVQSGGTVTDTGVIHDSSGVSATLNTWNHIAMAVSSTNGFGAANDLRLLYINGVLVAKDTTSTNEHLDGSRTFYAGRHTSPSHGVPGASTSSALWLGVVSGQEATDPDFLPPAMLELNPEVTSISPAGGLVPTEGGVITIYGHHFGKDLGAAGPSSPIAIEIAGTHRCANPTRTSPDVVECAVPPGIGVNYTLEFVRGGQSSFHRSTALDNDRRDLTPQFPWGNPSFTQPVMYFSFDDASARDVAGGAYHATRRGDAVNFLGGYMGYGVQMSASPNSRIVVKREINMHPQFFAVCLWVYHMYDTATLPSHSVLVAKGPATGGTTDPDFALTLKNDKSVEWTVRANNAPETMITAPNVIGEYFWHHVCATFTQKIGAGSSMNIYIDGALAVNHQFADVPHTPVHGASATAPFPITIGGSPILMAQNDAPDKSTYSSYAIIDEVAIWNGAIPSGFQLSGPLYSFYQAARAASAQVSTTDAWWQQHAERFGYPSSPVLEYRFEGASIAENLVDTGHGTISGGGGRQPLPLSHTSAGAPLFHLIGAIGNNSFCGGTGIDIESQPSKFRPVSTSGVTLCTWVLRDINTDATIFEFGNPGEDAIIGLDMTSAGEYRCSFTAQGTAGFVSVTTTGSATLLDEFHHVCCVYRTSTRVSASELSIGAYINGKPSGYVATGNAADLDSTSNSYLNGRVLLFNGKHGYATVCLDHLAVYERSLDPSEIAALAHRMPPFPIHKQRQGETPPATVGPTYDLCAANDAHRLVGYWNFDGGSIDNMLNGDSTSTVGDGVSKCPGIALTTAVVTQGFASANRFHLSTHTVANPRYVTLAAWFYGPFNTATTNRPRLGWYDPVAETGPLMIGYDSSYWSASFLRESDPTVFNLHPTAALPNGAEGLASALTWTHVAFTYESSGGPSVAKLYVNGKLVASDTGSDVALETLPADQLILGNFATADEVVVYNVTLTDHEIAGLAASGVPAYNARCDAQGNAPLIPFESKWLPRVPTGPTVSYEAPLIGSIVPWTPLLNPVPFGLFGNSFGPAGVAVNVTIDGGKGRVECLTVGATPPVTMVCPPMPLPLIPTAPYTDLEVSFEIGGQQAAPYGFNTQHAVTAVTPNIIAENVTTTITLHSADWIAFNTAMYVSFASAGGCISPPSQASPGPTAVTASVSGGHTTLELSWTPGPGTFTSSPYDVCFFPRSGGVPGLSLSQDAVAGAVHVYGAPNITGVSSWPVSGFVPGVAGLSITIDGAFFTLNTTGLADAAIKPSGTAYTGSAGCTSTFVSPTRVICTLSEPLSVGNLRLDVTRSATGTSDPDANTYPDYAQVAFPAPTLNAGTSLHLRIYTAAETRITVTGTGFDRPAGSTNITANVPATFSPTLAACGVDGPCNVDNSTVTDTSFECVLAGVPTCSGLLGMAVTRGFDGQGTFNLGLAIAVIVNMEWSLAPVPTLYIGGAGYPATVPSFLTYNAGANTTVLSAAVSFTSGTALGGATPTLDVTTRALSGLSPGAVAGTATLTVTLTVDAKSYTTTLTKTFTVTVANYPSPALSSISLDTSGAVGLRRCGSTVVTMAGRFLGPGPGNLTSGSVAGLPCAPLTFGTESSATCTVSMPGPFVPGDPVVVTTTAGQASLAAGPQLAPAPNVTAVSVSQHPAGASGSLTITIEGHEFGASASDLVAVTVAGVPCLPASGTWVSPTSLTCSSPSPVPAGGTAGHVVVTTDAGCASASASPASAFAFVAPAVTAASPSAVEWGATVTLHGSGFTSLGALTSANYSSAVLTVNVAAWTSASAMCVSFAPVSDSVATCALPLAAPAGNTDIASAVKLSFAVGSALGGPSLPGGEVDISSAAATSPSPVPSLPLTVTAVAPVVSPLAGGIVVTVSGTGLDATVAVTLAGIACAPVALAPSSNNVTSAVTCTAGPAATVTSGTVTVTRGAESVTAGVGFSYTVSGTTGGSSNGSTTTTATGALPPPAILSVSPSIAPVDGGGVTVEIIGAYLGVSHGDVRELSIGGVSCVASLEWVSAEKVRCKVPASPNLAPGPAEIRITTASSDGGTADGFVLIYIVPPPIVDDARPTRVTSAGGQTVLVLGRYFRDASPALFLSGLPCTSTAFISPQELSCVVPALPGRNGDALQVTARVAGVTSVPSAGSSGPVSIEVDDTHLPCAVPCGWEAECVAGVCVCNPGWALPPSCESPSFSVVLSNGVSHVAGRFVPPATVALLAKYPLAALVNTSEDSAGGGGGTGGATGADVVSIVPAADPGGTVVIEVTSSNPAEARPVPSRVTMPPFPSPGVVRIEGVSDLVRDGTVPYELKFTVVEAPAKSLGGPGLPVVRGVNADASPVILSVNPRTLAMVGGTFVMSLTHVDKTYKVRLIGAAGTVYEVPRSNITTLNATDTITAAATLRRGSIINNHKNHNDDDKMAAGGDSPLLLRLAQTAAPYPDVGARNVRVDVGPFEDKGYAAIEVLNDGGTRVLSEKVIFFSDDCPTEGQFGRGTECKPCPTGGECPGGYRIWPQPGYWNPGEESGYVVRCDPPEACVAGGIGGGQCAEQYSGPRCGQCADQFYKANGVCNPCPASGSTIIFIVADCVVWLLFALASVLIRDRMTLSYVVMTVRALQMLSGVGSMTEGSDIPSWVLTVYSVLHIFSGDYSFVKPDCVTPVPFSTIFGVSLAYNMAVFVPVFVAIGIASVVGPGRHEDPEKRQEERDHWVDRAIRMMVIWAAVMYLSITSLAIETLSCVPFGIEGGYHMITRPHETCYVGTHIVLCLFSSILLVGYTVGFPLGMLHWVKKAENYPKLHIDERFMERWNFLYEFYNDKNPTFWLIEFPITCIVAAGKSVLKPHVNYQMSISVAVFAYKLLYIIVRRPFIDWITDIIQAVLALVSMIAINMTFFDKHGVFEKVPALSTTMAAVIVSVLLVGVICMIAMVAFMLTRPVGEAEAKIGRGKAFAESMGGDGGDLAGELDVDDPFASQAMEGFAEDELNKADGQHLEGDEGDGFFSGIAAFFDGIFGGAAGEENDAAQGGDGVGGVGIAGGGVDHEGVVVEDGNQGIVPGTVDGSNVEQQHQPALVQE